MSSKTAEEAKAELRQGSDLQEQPESTIGHKPAELRQRERGEAQEGQEEEHRARRDEAEGGAEPPSPLPDG